MQGMPEKDRSDIHVGSASALPIIEKEIVREVARGDKPYMRKSTDRKAQISPLS